MRLSLLVIFFLGVLPCLSPTASAHTANKIWFEFRDNGRFRILINYTIPPLKEYREAYVDFINRKEAEAFYWHLVRGGDFHLGTPLVDHYHAVPKGPAPW